MASPSSRGGSCSAVIPGWSDMSRGMPGYSREVVGQTPFAWSLGDAMEGLGPRADRATGFWRWRASEGAWAGFQKAFLGHLLARLGPGARYWDVSAGKQPLAGVSERPATPARPFTVLSTIGMSCQRMPVVEQFAEDPTTCAADRAGAGHHHAGARTRRGSSCGSPSTPGAR